MFTLLTLDAARDSVARQDAGRRPPLDPQPPVQPGRAPAPRRPTTTAHRRTGRSASLARRAHESLMRTVTGMTWSPTR